MKKIIPFFAAIMFLAAIGFYLVYNTTIMVVQTVPNDSLAIGHDRSLKVGDTVTFTGRVVAPPLVKSGIDNRVLLRGTTSRTAYIQDTSNALFGGIIVRQGSITANTQFTTLDTGAKVIVTGIVGEFPDIISSGSTQIALDTTLIVTELPTIKRRPTPINVNISDFDTLGTVKFLSGERYEGMYVQISNVTVGPQSPLGARNIRSLLDAQGNKIYLRDFSNFFSISPNDTGFPVWTPPSIGATVTSIRGVIINSAYADANNGLFGYVIVPLYPNDLTLGNTPPFISSVSRSPGVPKPVNTVQVNAVVSDTLDRPISVDSCQLYYRINKGAYTKLNMSPTGNIYSATMPAQPLGTLVEYFLKAKDNQGASRLNPSDTSKSTYFYYVRNNDTMTIKDIQYTPNNGGFSGFNGYDVTTEGIVTADTSDIPAFSFTGEGGTQTSPRRVIIQDGNIAGGWSGIWIDGNATDPLVKGQRVRVRGTVSETNGMTRLIIATPGDIQVLASGQPIPNFEVMTPAIVADNKIDGDTTAEKWESVLIRFASQSVISCVNAASSSGCTSEFPVPDTSFRRNFGEILVVYPGENIEARIELQDGNHDKVNGWNRNNANYYNTSLPGSLLWRWDGISSLQGVLYYAFGKYKMVPRRNNDFGTVIGVEPINEIATQFWIKQNYPNPFNPVTNIVYNLPAESEVTLKIYNLVGQEVKTLVSGVQNKGKYEVKFDGMNLASGMYIYVIEANSISGSRFREVKKMVLVK
ncbi:MAG: T9SS type A sorting domain-containing protein [Ignavibacteria bacterium]|nr:T9SS type A sorting domain-containing protein [Ignavibacteria bacterium]